MLGRRPAYTGITNTTTSSGPKVVYLLSRSRQGKIYRRPLCLQHLRHGCCDPLCNFSRVAAGAEIYSRYSLSFHIKSPFFISRTHTIVLYCLLSQAEPSMCFATSSISQTRTIIIAYIPGLEQSFTPFPPGTHVFSIFLLQFTRMLSVARFHACMKIWLHEHTKGAPGNEQK